MKRPVALVTGASRRIGIGAGIARALASEGWDVATTVWKPYDAEMPWGADEPNLVAMLRDLGAQAIEIEADLSRPDAAVEVFDEVEAQLGPVTALIANHCHDIVTDIEATTVESFDLHFSVNARAVWLLVREFGRRFPGPFGTGRIIAMTSDHTAGNLPYGASKGAMERIVVAAAHEFRGQGITANIVHPGPTDTGWMSPELADQLRARTLLGRLGRPEDAANLVAFLCSDRGAWINGQIIRSDGGF
ncbi:MAG: SDR family oxidoreductase [Actinomycetota bacterium]